MTEPAPPSHRIDPRAARRFFERQINPDADVLGAEVSRRMAERLELIRLNPAIILDAGCGDADTGRILHGRYPRAYIVALDIARERMAARRRAPRSWRERARAVLAQGSTGCVCADFCSVPLRDRTVALLWSALALSWAEDAQAALREWHRVLQVDGLLMFATYGPDTLKELRSAFEGAGEHFRVQRFVDMHDIGDALIAAGFADPVMETEWMTLTYEDVESLVADLRATGQVNALAARPRGLLSPRKWNAVRTAYEEARKDGRLPATFEIVYGHAWKAAPRHSADGRAIIRFDLPRSR